MSLRGFLFLLMAIPLGSHAQLPTFPLKEAARGGDLAKVVALLDAGADLEQEDDGQNTALISASWHDHADVVRELLKRGVKTGHRNQDGYSGLDYGMERGHRQVVSAFVEYWLKSARSANHVEEVRVLEAIAMAVETGAKGSLPDGLHPDEPNASGYGPLAMACRWGAQELVGQLLALGANPNKQSDSRYQSSPLMEATRDGNVEIAKMLLAAGADVNLRDRHGDHALNWAAFFGHPGMVRLLVEKGSRLDFTGQSPETALQIATREGHQEAAAIIKAAASAKIVGDQ
jgi:uncharacterized protein